MRRVLVIEDRHIQSMRPENIPTKIARVNAEMKRYAIKSPSKVFNLDESGCRFEKMTGTSLRRAIAEPGSGHVQQNLIRTKGNLSNVTIIPVVSVDGR